MKKTRNDFSADEVRQMLHYDPITGAFTWRYRPNHPQRWNTRFAGKPAGTRGKTGYIYIEIKRKLPTQAGRIAWLLMTGVWPEKMIDHRNGIRDDNRWANLRCADASENAANKGRQRNNTSGFIGVHFDRGKWRARVNFRRTSYDVGFFSTPKEAAEARAKFLAALKVQGDYAPERTEHHRYFHYRDDAAKGE